MAHCCDVAIGYILQSGVEYYAAYDHAIGYVAISVSPSSFLEWLRLDSTILASLGLRYCHNESFGRLVPILAPSTGTL